MMAKQGVVIGLKVIISLGLLGPDFATAHPLQSPNTRWNREEQRESVIRFEYAPVVDVDPIMTRVRVIAPQRECWHEDREVVIQRSATPTVVGAIIGGVIGHQLGSGSSRGLATVAGAVLGASVGNDVSARGGRVDTRSIERCESYPSRTWIERVEGYRVTYVYRGREYATVMAYDPGNEIKLKVGIEVEVVQ